jgi:hypothetical protein
MNTRGNNAFDYKPKKLQMDQYAKNVANGSICKQALQMDQYANKRCKWINTQKKVQMDQYANKRCKRMNTQGNNAFDYKPKTN